MKLFAMWPTGPDGGVTVVVADSEKEAKLSAVDAWDGDPFYNGAKDWGSVTIIEREIKAGLVLRDEDGVMPSFWIE